jgi:hypothetical protein
MSLKGFQQAVVDLTLSPKWCRALRRGESSLLDQYDLNERERNRLMEMSRRRGMAMICSLARGNRLEVIVDPFPKTCILLKPLLPRLLDELWEQHKPDNYQLFGEEDAFAVFIARKIGQGELSVEYLSEIFAYELTCRDLAIQRETSTGGDTTFDAIVEFQHPPGELLPPLNRLVAPPSGLPYGIFRARVRLSEAGFAADLLPV